MITLITIKLILNPSFEHLTLYKIGLLNDRKVMSYQILLLIFSYLSIMCMPYISENYTNLKEEKSVVV